MKKKGYICLHRKILENPIIMKDSDHLAVWIYLLLEATHESYDAEFKGKRITLLPGQLITGSKSIAMKLKINYVKVHRILDEFKNENQIEKQVSNKNSLITISKWHEYQNVEKPKEKQAKSNCNSSEIPLKTNNNVNNNVNNEKEEINKEEKYGFFHNVILSNVEYEKLKEQFPDYEEKIDNLSGYIASKGDKYKSHYLTILNWARKDNAKMPEWFNKEVKQDKEGLEELEKVLEEFK